MVYISRAVLPSAFALRCYHSIHTYIGMYAVLLPTTLIEKRAIRYR